MLSLATHEPHFKVLREDVFFQEGSSKNCFICNQPGHMASQCTGRFSQSCIKFIRFLECVSMAVNVGFYHFFSQGNPKKNKANLTRNLPPLP